MKRQLEDEEEDMAVKKIRDENVTRREGHMGMERD